MRKLLTAALLAVLAAPPACTARPPLQSGDQPQGTLVVLNKQDGTATLVDVANGRTLRTVEVGRAPHEGVAGPDGRTVYVANYEGGRTLAVLDVAGEAPAYTIDLGEKTDPHGLAFAGDRLLVTAEGQQALLVVDPAARAVTRRIPTAAAVSHMVAPATDGRRAFVANIGSGSMTALDLETGTILAQVPTGAGAEGIAVTPDGGLILVSNRAADTVSVIDARSLAVQAEIPCQGFPIRVQVTPDGARALVSCATAHELAVLDVAGRRETARVSFAALGENATPIGVLIHPSGREAYVALAGLKKVAAVDLGSLAVRATFDAGNEPDGMAFVPGQDAPRPKPATPAPQDGGG